MVEFSNFTFITSCIIEGNVESGTEQKDTNRYGFLKG